MKGAFGFSPPVPRWDSSRWSPRILPRIAARDELSRAPSRLGTLFSGSGARRRRRSLHEGVAGTRHRGAGRITAPLVSERRDSDACARRHDDAGASSGARRSPRSSTRRESSSPGRCRPAWSSRPVLRGRRSATQRVRPRTGIQLPTIRTGNKGIARNRRLRVTTGGLRPPSARICRINIPRSSGKIYCSRRPASHSE